MKINIKEIHLRNFLSIGNTWLTFQFREGLYRITGENLDNNTKNDVGKSTMVCDSLMYGLFGKPLRRINLSDIPNTINNKKDCEVKLFLSVENREYMIHRGIQPSFLKFYENYKEGDENLKDNENEKQDSAKKFTQKRIDEIIGANFNTYSHLLIMSNSYAVPFLDLKTEQKREILEDILGVGMFGEMTEHVKEEITTLKSNLNVISKEYEINNNNLTQLKNTLEKLKSKAELFEDNKSKKLAQLKEEILSIKEQIDQSNIEDVEEIDKKMLLIEQYLDKFTANEKEISKKLYSKIQENKSLKQVLNEIEDKSICPLCNTSTNSEHVKQHVESMLQKTRDIEHEACNLSEEKDKLKKKIDDVINKEKEYKLKRSNIQKQLHQIEILSLKKKNLIKDYKQINEEKNTYTELINEDEVITKQNELHVLQNKINELGIEKEYSEFIKKILSDTGIKNYIIKKVVTYWNQKVNFYLSKLNAEFTIKFDDTLNAIIKSRNRDELQYHSFSGGEKARIDVAILLSIIDISKLQNSIDLNVMVIDELLDSGLDETGREDVLNLFKDMCTNQNKSIYVISHNTNLPIHLFKKEVILYKKNGFTTLQA